LNFKNTSKISQFHNKTIKGETMSKASPLKIDIFAHIMPEKFKDAFEELVPNHE